MRCASNRPPRRDEAGFSLLELLAAITLFSVIVVGFVYAKNNAIEQAGAANDERILRYLAGYQLGYLRLGYDPQRNEYDLGQQGGDFAHLGDLYGSFYWSANIEEVVVAGKKPDDSDAVDLFVEEDDTFEEDEEEEGEAVILLRITMRVYHESMDEESGLQIVTFRQAPREGGEGAEGAGG